jgi:hypothetical protein
MDETRSQYDGTPVYMAGKTWTIPGLSVRQFKKYFPVLAKSADIPKDAPIEDVSRMLNEALDERLPVILAAIQRNYPEVTEEQLLDMVDANNVPAIMKAISLGSGLRPAKPGE